MWHHRHSIGRLRCDPRVRARKDPVEVTRGEARPLRSISNPMHLAMKCFSTLGRDRLATYEPRTPFSVRHGDTACLMPTPRATWLEEPHSVDPDLSRPLSISQTPPLRVRCRAAASCAVVPACADDGESYLREPSPHSMARFRRQGEWAGRVPSCRARRSLSRSPWE
jgi:hypothetical protein